MQVATPKKGYKLVKTSFGKYEEIPEDWEPLTLKQVCEEIASGGTPSRTKKEYFGGDIPWVVVSDIKRVILQTSENLTEEGLKNSSAKLWPIGTVILSTGATIGKVGIAGVELCTKQGVTGLVPKKSLYNYFLAYYLESITDVLKRGAVGATITEIYKKDLGKIFVPLPSLSKQKQITSILSNVDDTIQKTDQIIKQTQRLKKGLMQELLTKGIGHTKFKEYKYGLPWMKSQIPLEWDAQPLPNVAKFRQGLQIAKIKRYSKWAKNRIKLIKILDFYDDISTEEYIDTPSDSQKRVICNKDDIIIARTGNTLGMILTDVEGVFHNNTFALDYDQKLLEKYFFSYFLKSNLVQRFMKIISTRSGQPDLTHKEFSILTIPLPPLQEQQQIASILSNVDTQIQKEKLHKSNLERLKKGLMQKLLTGQIRVKV